ncbi:MAG: hypothetical protein Q7U47_08155 [Paludibacter sp.]|nr:hypothetical protein [Paludibacter sp.]
MRINILILCCPVNFADVFIGEISHFVRFHTSPDSVRLSVRLSSRRSLTPKSIRKNDRQSVFYVFRMGCLAAKPPNNPSATKKVLKHSHSERSDTDKYRH